MKLLGLDLLRLNLLDLLRLRLLGLGLKLLELELERRDLGLWGLGLLLGLGPRRECPQPSLLFLLHALETALLVRLAYFGLALFFLLAPVPLEFFALQPPPLGLLLVHHGSRLLLVRKRLSCGGRRNRCLSSTRRLPFGVLQGSTLLLLVLLLLLLLLQVLLLLLLQVLLLLLYVLLLLLLVLLLQLLLVLLLVLSCIRLRCYTLLNGSGLRSGPL